MIEAPFSSPKVAQANSTNMPIDISPELALHAMLGTHVQSMRLPRLGNMVTNIARNWIRQNPEIIRGGPLGKNINERTLTKPTHAGKRMPKITKNEEGPLLNVIPNASLKMLRGAKPQKIPTKGENPSLLEVAL